MKIGTEFEFKKAFNNGTDLHDLLDDAALLSRLEKDNPTHLVEEKRRIIHR